MEQYQTLYYAILIFWYVIFLFFIIYLSQVHSGEYKSQYKNNRYTSIPSKKIAVELSLLMYKKISPEVLTVSVLAMVDKGIFRLEKIEDDYILHLNSNINQNKLIASEKFVITLLIETMGEGDHIYFSEISSFCESNYGRSTFLLNYDLWLTIIRKETTLTNYYEPKTCYTKVIFCKYVGLILFLVNIFLGYHSIIGYGMIIPSLFLEFYFLKVFKRTKRANDEYYKWLSFKKHLPNLEDANEENENELLYYGFLLKVKNIEKLLKKDYCYGMLNDGLINCVKKAYNRSYKVTN